MRGREVDDFPSRARSTAPSGVMRLVLAFVAAVLVPAFAVTAWYLYDQFQAFGSSDSFIWVRSRGFLALCVSSSAAHVVALGLPAYLYLRTRGALHGWWTVCVGVVLGAIPVAVFAWPLRDAHPGNSSSYDGVPMMIDGRVTLAGWAQYAAGVSFMGACGAAAAVTFWLVVLKKWPSRAVRAER